jgi:hypothetical protein
MIVLFNRDSRLAYGQGVPLALSETPTFRTFEPRESVAERLVKAVVGVGALMLGAWAISELFDQHRPPKKRRPYNCEPVRWDDKEYVSARDGWRCVYCGHRVNRRTRHVDHRVSRINGGTNHVNNLALACVPCNLAKGALNARQFLGIS